jgi:hypothetical protein
MTTTDEFRQAIGAIPDVLDRCILYQQYGENISEVNSVTEFEVTGDATSLLPAASTILFPLKEFTTEYTVSTSIYDAPNNKTVITITASASLSSNDDIGRTVCLKIDITERLTKNGVGNVDQRIEGAELTDYDSGSMKIIVDNSDGYFHDKDGNGVFDSGDVFWFIYINGFKGDSNRVNYFGGLVEPSIKPNLYDRIVEFIVYGHSKELERYPAYRTVETDTEQMMMPNLVGVRVIRYTSSSRSEEGVKEIKFDPTSESDMEGVTVVKVSDDTLPGIKTLEFRAPYYFRWNFGDWTKVTTATVDDGDGANDIGNGNQKIFQKDGSGDSGYALVNFGYKNGLNEFPEYDTVKWVIVKLKDFSLPLIKDQQRDIKDVIAQGKPTLIYDNGRKTTIYPFFPRITLYDATGAGSYSDVSDQLNEQLDILKPVVEVLNDTDDELIAVGTDKFFGIEFYISTPASNITEIKVYFSTGFQSWQEMTLADNGLTDNTTRFSLGRNRSITWTSADNWQPNFIYADGVAEGSDYVKGYMIRIVRISGSGSGAYLQYIKKMLLLKGTLGDFIEVVADNNRVPLVAKDDEVCIYRKNDGTFGVGTWYLCAAYQYLLEDMLDNVNYDSSKRTLLDTKTSLSTAGINVWGQPPKRDYNYEPHIAIKHTDNYVYLGIGTELWRAGIDGKLEYLCTFNVNVSPVLTINEIYITDIWFDTGVVYCLMVQQYDVLNQNVSNHCVMGKYTVASRVAELISEDDANQQFCYPGQICVRHGTEVNDAGNWYTDFGQDVDGSGRDVGENLVVPFKQIISGSIISDNNNALVPAVNVDSTPGDGPSRLPIWYFHDTPQGGGWGDNSGPYFNCPEGVYCVQDRASEAGSTYLRLWFKWKMGQQGLIIIDRTNHDVYLIRYVAGDSCYKLLSLKTTSPGTIFNKWKSWHVPDFPLCGDYDSNNDILYMSHVRWYDAGVTTKSYGYITAFNNTKITDWGTVFKYNNTGAVYTDITSAVNAGTPQAAIYDEAGDIIYFGFDGRFNRLNFDLSADTNTYVFEYYNSAWVALENTPPDTTLDTLEFTIPHDWIGSTVNSVTLFWIRVRCTVHVGNADLDDGRLLEYVLWDSQADETISNQRHMPLWIVHNPTENTLHGCAFNREWNHDYYFEWSYFVFRLDTNVMYRFRTGDNYTFVGSKIMKDFVFNSVDDDVYFMVEDIRYQEDEAFLAKASFNTSTNALTLTQLATPSTRCWGSNGKLTVAANGQVFGITKGDEHVVWEFGTDLYPRMEIAQFGDDNVKQVLSEFGKIINAHLFIKTEREISYVKRETYSSTESLTWGLNLRKKRFGIEYWEHYYDATIIKWSNPFTNESGKAKRGLSGWLKKILEIDSTYIQNQQLAELVIDDVADYFSTKRLFVRKMNGLYLNNLLLLMRYNVIIPSDILDLSSSKYFLITILGLVNKGNRYVIIEGVEL